VNGRCPPPEDSGARLLAIGRWSMPKSRVLLSMLLVLCSVSCDMHWASPFDVVRGQCAGQWEAAPLWRRGPGLPDPDFRTLEIEIERVSDGDQPLAAFGTVSWNGVAWPMTIEWSPEGGPFCRYADGHPFRDPRNPDGFHFSMLEESGGDPDDEQLFIDFARDGSEPPHSLEQDWYCYERVE
jgi:hypothetical protein